MTAKLLAIDDDIFWCDMLQARLTDMGFQVEVVYDVISGMQKAYSFHPDAILMDLIMPGIGGEQACHRFREVAEVPIIILTAMRSTEHMVDCLNGGADDYIVKTVSIAELVARIQAVLRRTSHRPHALEEPGSRESVFTYSGLIVDFQKRRVTVDGKKVKLSPKEFSLLSLLVKHKGRVLPHEYLLSQVWGPDYTQDLVSLRLYIGYLRRKIEKDPTHPNLIQSEWGVGYRFA